MPSAHADIAKSFSVLEGIGLSVDPNYSIIDETLPYISKRILTDPSPRTAGALATFVFGDAKDDVSARVLDAGRVETLVEGARRYAASTVTPTAEAEAGSAPTADARSASVMVGGADGAMAGGGGGDGAATTPPVHLSVAGFDVDAASDAIFDLLLTKEPSPLQEIVLEQLALVIGATSRELFAELRARSGTSSSTGRSRLGRLVDPLGLFRGSPLVEADERDRQALQAAAKLAQIASEVLPATGTNGASEPSAAALSNEQLRQLAQLLARKVWVRRQELGATSRRLTSVLLDQTAQRVLQGRQTT